MEIKHQISQADIQQTEDGFFSSTAQSPQKDIFQEVEPEQFDAEKARSGEHASFWLLDY